MHYYQFNIADYRKDTQHLTPMEHYIYRELMDWYYLDENPIPTKTQSVIRRLRLVSENNQELINVLEEFFTETEEGWVHGRIEHEIEAYKAKAETARVNGSKGGRPKKPTKTKAVNLANPEITGSKANHKPLTNNHKPSKRGAFAPPSAQMVSEYLLEKNVTTIDPVHFVDFYSARGWKLSSGTKMADWKAAVRTWINREDKTNEVRPRGNPEAGGPKPTPGQRARAKQEEARRRQLGMEPSNTGGVVSVQ